MKNFSDYFTFEQFMTIANFSLHNNMHKDKPPINLNELKEEILFTAVHDFLKDYNKEKGLNPLANNVGHRTNFGYFWDNFITNNVNKKDYSQDENKKNDSRELGRLIGKEVFFSFYLDEKDIDKINPEFWKERYSQLITKINDGNFKHYMLPENYCFESGTTFHLGLTNWQPQLLERVLVYKDKDWFKDKYEYLPAPDYIVSNKINLEVEFTSGQLLITDWFRLEQFTNTVDSKGVFNDDVNCSLGRINQSTRYAKDFNFISTPSGGMPHIFKNGNELIIGEYDEEKRSKNLKTFESNYEDKGYISCQLRAITIIDYDQLIELLTVEKGNDDSIAEAKKILTQYIKENNNEILKLKVTPGQYTFEFSGDYYDLRNHIEEKLPSAIKPYLILKDSLSYNAQNTTDNVVKKKNKLK